MQRSVTWQLVSQDDVQSGRCTVRVMYSQDDVQLVLTMHALNSGTIWGIMTPGSLALPMPRSMYTLCRSSAS